LIIPRVGDIWEIKTPGKRKKRKEIGGVRLVLMRKKDGSCVHRPYIDWFRYPKGRYTGIRVKWLLKYGTRISTKAERNTELKARIIRCQAKRNTNV